MSLKQFFIIMEACAEIRRVEPTDKRGHNYKTIPSLSENYVAET